MDHGCRSARHEHDAGGRLQGNRNGPHAVRVRARILGRECVPPVPLTFVVGRAVVRVGAAERNRVFIDVAVMEVVQVTIMKIVRMTFVA